MVHQKQRPPRSKRCVMSFRPDIVNWAGRTALPLAPDEGVRTVILHDVESLSPEDQQQLLVWLKTNLGSVQVVATTARPLLELVESAKFDRGAVLRVERRLHQCFRLEGTPADHPDSALRRRYVAVTPDLSADADKTVVAPLQLVRSPSVFIFQVNRRALNDTKQGTHRHWHRACLNCGNAPRSSCMIAFSRQPSVADFMKGILEEAGYAAIACWSTLDDLERAVSDHCPAAVIYEVGFPLAAEWERFCEARRRPTLGPLAARARHARSPRPLPACRDFRGPRVFTRPTRHEVEAALEAAFDARRRISDAA